MSTTPGAALSLLAGHGRPMPRPGAGLSRAAQPLASPTRALGTYPYQWSDPGPNSRPAMPSGSIAIPQIVSPATSASGLILNYEVPEGYRFVLTDLAIGAFAPDWAPGSGSLLFSLVVKYSTGPRNVEFLASLAFGLGLFVGGGVQPVPWRGRSEFAPLDVLQVSLVNSGIATPGANDYAVAALWGHTYPTSESA